MTPKILKALFKKESVKIKKRGFPKWISPMLATLVHEVFDRKGWIFERKLDGERCLVYKKAKRVSLKSRNKKELGKTYPEIKSALRRAKAKNFVIDGEIVAFEGKLTSFSKLQPRMQVKSSEKAKATGIKVYFYIFDVLYWEGRELTGLGLLTRKKILKKMFSFQGPLRWMTHRKNNGKKFYGEACKKGWEGLIAKDGEGEYEKKRSRKWLKFKCENRQEFVIVGYTQPKGERKGFGALLLGYYDKKALKFAGKVGTGFDEVFLKRFAKQLKNKKIKTPPIDKSQNWPKKNIQWVRPHYVVEVSFTEWTSDGKLRHPRFLGLRRDKKPKEVKREQN